MCCILICLVKSLDSRFCSSSFLKPAVCLRALPLLSAFSWGRRGQWKEKQLIPLKKPFVLLHNFLSLFISFFFFFTCPVTEMSPKFATNYIKPPTHNNSHDLTLINPNKKSSQPECKRQTIKSEKLFKEVIHLKTDCYW